MAQSEYENPIADPIVEVVDTDAQSQTVVINATAEGVATVVINRPHRKNASGSGRRRPRCLRARGGWDVLRGRRPRLDAACVDADGG